MTDINKLLTQFYLQLDGQDATADLFAALEQIEVESSLHLPAVATLVLHDPKLTWVDAANLAPGVALTVSVKLANRPTPLFNGEIVEIEPDFGPDGQRLVVRAFDRLHRLARGRFARSFVNVTDDDLLKKLAAEVGLTAKSGPTPEVHPYVLQANESNLAFLQKRAAALGYLLYVKGTTLHCEAPAAGTTTELTYAQDLVAFRPRLSTVGQIEKVTVRSWDMIKKQELVGVSSTPKAAPKVGATRKKVFNMEPEDLWPDCRVRTQAEATKLAQAVAEQHASRFIEAEGSCGGNPALVAGGAVKISGVGTRFSGTYFITSAMHRYDADSGYTTEFRVSGMNPATLVSTLLPIEDAPPVGGGLVIGIVTDNKDPDKLGRVKVKFPWLTAEHASHWARVVSVGAGNGRGVLFTPEVNDEVLVGFEQDSPNTPYVLGGLWNGKDKPPSAVSDVVDGGGNVQQRLISSRVGHELVMGENAAGGDGFVHLKTKAGRIVKISDTDKGVLIKTDNHSLKLDDQGRLLAIESGGDLNIKANGKVSIEGQTGVEVKSNTTMALNANATMEIKANATMAISSNAPMDVKSSAILNLQGTLVKIN